MNIGVILSLFFCGAFVPEAQAEDIRFPKDSGVVDVTQAPYFTKGDGKTDCTASLQKALNEHTGRGRTLYFPRGTYLISSTLKLPLQNPQGETNWGHTHLQGQSRGGTVIRLKDSTFTDPSHPSALIDSGPHGSADWFHNSVRNLTLDVGRNNPGAIGLRFFSNNTGCVREVTIRSADGQGVIGLDLAFNDMNGPLLVKDVMVKGFNIGVACGHTVNSQTFSDIRLEGQRQVGFRNNGQFLAIENLQSRNAVPALDNRSGLIALVGARLVAMGSGPRTPAIRNTADLYARNIWTSGYRTAIEGTGGQQKHIAGPHVKEFVSGPIIRLFPSPPRALHLPIQQTPTILWDDPSNWTSPLRYGARLDDESDAAPAIQAAIDSGATTLYFPKGTYRIGHPVIVRGRIRRIIGCESTFVPISPLLERKDPLFRVEKGSAPTILLERMTTSFDGGPFYFVEHASPRTLIMKDIAINFQGADSFHNRTGAGPAFIENVVGGRFYFTHQSVWARQLNQESEGLHIANESGRFWVLGLKTERGGTLIHTSVGGQTEVLGGLCYTTTAGKLAPMFINANSSVSVTLGERHYGSDPYTTILSETRGSETKQFLSTDTQYGRRLVLYAGYAAPRPNERVQTSPAKRLR